jgi:hypothetical protein
MVAPPAKVNKLIKTVTFSRTARDRNKVKNPIAHFFPLTIKLNKKYAENRINAKEKTFGNKVSA